MRRGLLCVDLQPPQGDGDSGSGDDGDSISTWMSQGSSPASKKSGRATARAKGEKLKGKKRPRKKTDALLTLVYGYASSRYTHGRTEKRRGGIKKSRK